MYWLMSIDAIVRIGLGIVILFVAVPALVLRASPAATLLERFFWNLAMGIILITLAGQILTLANLFSLGTLALAIAVVALIARARQRGVSAAFLVKRTAEDAFLAVLNVIDGRVSIRRRIRRQYRRVIHVLREKTATREVRLRIAGWTAVAAIAAAFRFYRALASANLGFSDTYVHLYLLKLLGEGRQVDPDFGPYPRGMHFVLMAIQQLTNVDEILLVNFFGGFVGVLLTLAVADAARRLAGSLRAGLLAGFLFATLVGGPGQYFILGGGIATDDESRARTFLHLSYSELLEGGEFDLALTAFHRQTSTLSQELAIVLLFPAAMFLLSYFRTKERWHLVGFAASTASIAAVHSGVVVPLVVMSALLSGLLAARRLLRVREFLRAAGAGAAAVLVGSSWALAFIVYPYSDGREARESESVRTTILYYFPFLRSISAVDVTDAAADGVRVFVGMTPMIAVCVVLAFALLALAFGRRNDRTSGMVWLAATFLMFLLIHFASTLGVPQIVETARNSQWLLMSMTILVGVVTVTGATFIGQKSGFRHAPIIALTALVLAWGSRVPALNQPVIHDRIVNYSGYGASALAVMRIDRSFQPYTWTLVSYGQEFPMVLKRGFHLPAVEFLDRYDPADRVVPIPTPHIFVVVEKTPHPFQVNAWARLFDRAEVEQRLQTWVFLYQASHPKVSVFLEDEHVRVYHLERSAEELSNRFGGK